MVAVLEQLDGELCAAVRLRPDPAAVQLDDFLGQRQPDPGPAVAPRAPHVHLVEALEDLLRLLGGKAGPVVVHPDGCASPGIAKLQQDLPARLGELGGVGKQVEEHPLHPLQVAPDQAGPGLQIEPQLDALSLRERLHLRGQPLQVLAQVVLVHLQAQLALLHLGEVEQVADHLEELQPAAEHRLEGGLLGRAQLPHLALEDQLQRRQHHRQRGLELVGDVGEELRLEAVELLELLVGPLQRELGLLQAHLAGQHLALRAVEDDLADRRHHRDGEEEGQVRRGRGRRSDVPQRQVGHYEGHQHQRAFDHHHRRSPDEDQARADDAEGEPGVVGRGEPAHVPGHRADAAGRQQHVAGGEEVGEPREQRPVHHQEEQQRGGEEEGPGLPEEGQRFARRQHPVEDAEPRVEGGAEQEDDAHSPPVALEQPELPALLERRGRVLRRHQSLEISTNGLTPLSSSSSCSRAPGAALAAISISSARVR